MGKWLGRAGIAAIFILWMIAGMQLLAGKAETKEDAVAEAFSKIGDTEQEGMVEYYGVLKEGGRLTSLEERETYLRGLAKQMGITDHILISRMYGEDSQTTVLEKRGANADTTFRLVTWREQGEVTKQTLFAHISLDSDLEMALKVRRKLKKEIDGDMETVRSYAAVMGAYEGKLSLEERNRVTDDLFAEMEADVVTEHRDMKLYTVYGYTPYLKESVRQGKKHINVNIAMYYSESENKTCVYGAVPVVGIDY